MRCGSNSAKLRIELLKYCTVIKRGFSFRHIVNNSVMGLLLTNVNEKTTSEYIYNKYKEKVTI